MVSAAGAPLGRKEDNADIGQQGHCRFDMRLHLGPVQPSQTASKRRDGDGLNTVLADCLGQRFQSGFNILHSAFAPPVPLGGKVDDKAGVGQLPGLVDKHPDCCAVPVMSNAFCVWSHVCLPSASLRKSRFSASIAMFLRSSSRFYSRIYSSSILKLFHRRTMSGHIQTIEAFGIRTIFLIIEVFSNLYHMTYMVAYRLLLEMPVQHPILNTLRVLFTPTRSSPAACRKYRR